MEVVMANPRSTAQIAGHPIHPMLIPFPIAFFAATLVCDLVFWRTASTAWATAALWLLGAGLVMAALAAVAGLIDLLGGRQIRALNNAWWLESPSPTRRMPGPTRSASRRDGRPERTGEPRVYLANVIALPHDRCACGRRTTTVPTIAPPGKDRVRPESVSPAARIARAR